jgi:HSP20 family protein
VPTTPWVPPADLVETDRDYLLIVDIAGAEAEDIEVTYGDGELVVAGVRREQPTGPRQRLVSEIRLGRFERRMTLPGPVDLTSARARYERGLVRVTLRKVRAAPVRIVRR